jgi:ABC-type spermidine/putrescine transport system permease subunit II
MWRRNLGTAYLVLIIGFLLVPGALAIPVSFNGIAELQFPPTGFSFQWYASLFNDSGWRSSLALSAEVAALATILSLSAGSLAAWALMRRLVLLRRVVFVMLGIPLVVPTVVLATGEFEVLLRLGSLDPVWLLIVVHAAMALPLVVLVCAAGVQAIDPDLENAARSLGASAMLMNLRLRLPLLLPSLLVAGILAFITSWDEVVVASFVLSSNPVQTVPVKMFGYLRDAVDPTPAAISSLLLGITVIALLVVYLIQRSLIVPPGKIGGGGEGEVVMRAMEER